MRNHLSIDAVPDFHIDLAEPPGDWQFNQFLAEIASSLTQKEFDDLKHMFSGK